MRPGKRRLLAVLLAVGLVAVLLLFVSLGSRVANNRVPRIVARHVGLAVPPRLPPPPPPPPIVATIGSPGPPDLNIKQAPAPAPRSLLQELNVKVNVPAGDLGVPNGGGIGKGGAGFGGNGGAGFGVKWEGFQTPYLDSIPMVKSAPFTDYPKALLARGIHTMYIKVLIQIDEDGKPTLLDILSTPYPPFDDALRKYVSKVRFTSPTVGGKKVKAVYVWPLAFHVK